MRSIICEFTLYPNENLETMHVFFNSGHTGFSELKKELGIF